MERIYHKSENFKEAEDWDIEQCTSISADERRKIAKILKERVYGKNPPCIKKTRTFNKIKIK